MYLAYAMVICEEDQGMMIDSTAAVAELWGLFLPESLLWTTIQTREALVGRVNVMDAALDQELG